MIFQGQGHLSRVRGQGQHDAIWGNIVGAVGRGGFKRYIVTLGLRRIITDIISNDSRFGQHANTIVQRPTASTNYLIVWK
jgi:hypothetical protein